MAVYLLFFYLHLDAFNKFMKLRWSTADAATIVRGNVLISEEGMNIRVTSEAYYFFYTKIQFRHEETATYKYVLLL